MGFACVGVRLISESICTRLSPFIQINKCMIPRGIVLCEATNKIVSSVCLVYGINLKISENIFMKFGNKDISSRCLGS